MNRVNAVVCAALVTACASPVQPPEPPPGFSLADPRPLAGHWFLEVREPSPMERLPIVGERDPWLVAEVDLQLAADTVDGVIAPRDSLVGTMSHADLYLGDTVIMALKASGRVQSDGRAVITVTYPGPCPCGTMTLTGVIADREVTGHSEHRWPEHVGRHRFRMRRR